MEFTQGLLPQLLNAKIHKMPEVTIRSKVEKLKRLAPPLDKLLGHKEIRWQPSCAFEVSEPSNEKGFGACHDFVIFGGSLKSPNGDEESWGLCLHYKNCQHLPSLSLYLLPAPTMSHLTQFRTFVTETLRCLGSPAHMSFVRLEKLPANGWKVASMKYSNGISSPVPKIFFETVIAL